MIFEKVRDIIVDTLSCDMDEVTMDVRLTDDLGADSLSLVELIMAIEDSFGISVPESELPNIKKVSDIVAYIEANTQQ